MLVRTLFLLFLYSISSAFAANDNNPVCLMHSDSMWREMVGTDTHFSALFEMSRSLAGYKSDAEVDAYLKCWKYKTKRTDFNELYKNKYRASVKAASEASGVPFPILACLFFKESHWDKNIHSPVGAVGIAQVMPGTWKTIISYLHGKSGLKNENIPTNLRKNVKRDGGPLDRIITRIEDIYHESYKDGILADLNQMDVLHSLLHAYIRIRGSRLAGNANQYLDNVDYAKDKAEIQKIYADYVAKVGHEPARMEPDDPDAAIIVGTYYLKISVFGGLEEKRNLDRFPPMDRWIIAAGTYNSGPAGLKCKFANTAQECIDATSNKETKRHMQSILNCSEQGNQKPMAGDEDAKACYQ